MRLIMTLLVRDEQDILRANIEYHLAQGVDFIIASDNLSRDRTPEILRDYAGTGVLHLIEETGDDYSQAKWVTRMARMAATRFGADWVINNDADEFWWPVSGSLKSTLETVPATVGRVKARRYNFPASSDESDEFYRSMLMRELESFNDVGMRLPTKVCHRAGSEVVVVQGNHNVRGMAAQGVADDGLIEILHFPLRTFRQFENKIIKGGAAYARNQALPRGVGITWRRLYEEYQAGRLRDRYADRMLVADTGDNRELVRDTRLLEYLQQLPPVVGDRF